MTSRTKIFSAIFSAAAAAVIVLATVAVARTVHSHRASAVAAVHQSAAGAAPSSTVPAMRHNFGCASPSEAECEKQETWFPE